MSDASSSETTPARRAPARRAEATPSVVSTPVPADAPVKPVRDKADGTPPTPEELRADIAVTRAEISETVAELAVRLDVKTRVKERAAELRAQAQPFVKPAALGAAVAVAFTSVWLGLRSRRR